MYRYIPAFVEKRRAIGPVYFNTPSFIIAPINALCEKFSITDRY